MYDRNRERKSNTKWFRKIQIRRYKHEKGKPDRIVIPGKVSGTVIKANAFSGCTELKEVVIGEEVTTIGGHAFSAYGVSSPCNKLTSVIIPDNVTDFGNAFQACKGLKEVVIGKEVRGYRTFEGYSCMIYLVVGKLQLDCPPLFA